MLAVVSSVFSCSGKLVRTSTTTSWLPTIADKLGPVEVPLSVCQIASRTLTRVPDANPSISHSAVIVLAFGLAFDRTTAVRLPESGPAHTCIGSPGFAAGGGTGGCGGLWFGAVARHRGRSFVPGPAQDESSCPERETYHNCRTRSLSVHRDTWQPSGSVSQGSTRSVSPSRSVARQRYGVGGGGGAGPVCRIQV